MASPRLSSPWRGGSGSTTSALPSRNARRSAVWRKPCGGEGEEAGVGKRGGGGRGWASGTHQKSFGQGALLRVDAYARRYARLAKNDRVRSEGAFGCGQTIRGPNSVRGRFSRRSGASS